MTRYDDEESLQILVRVIPLYCAVPCEFESSRNESGFTYQTQGYNTVSSTVSETVSYLSFSEIMKIWNLAISVFLMNPRLKNAVTFRNLPLKSI